MGRGRQLDWCFGHVPICFTSLLSKVHKLHIPIENDNIEYIIAYIYMCKSTA